MTDPRPESETPDIEGKAETASQSLAPAPVDKVRSKSLSMHDDVAVWCDCCTCEAEPYWIEAAEAMGMKRDGGDQVGDG